MRETNTDVWNLSTRKQTTHARDAAASRPRRIVVYVSMIRRRSRVPSRWRSSRSLVAPRFPSRRGGGLHAGDSRGLDAATAAHAVCVYLHGVHVSRGDADGESAPFAPLEALHQELTTLFDAQRYCDAEPSCEGFTIT